MNYADNSEADFAERDPLEGVDQVIANRWSPRRFTKTSVSDADVEVLFDAARWAPSCFNEQPWRFYVSTESSFDDYLSLLVDANKEWAGDAALLCFVVAKNSFSRNGKPNDYTEFDCGAAWMALSVQARHMGLYTHAMGGIKHDEVAKHFELDEDHSVICGVAIGQAKDRGLMTYEESGKEKPTGRDPLSKILLRV